MCDNLLNLKSCDFQCRLNRLLSFSPCDVRWDDVILEYKQMVVSLRDYCKQLKARIALMQKHFDCTFTTALEDRVAKIKSQVSYKGLLNKPPPPPPRSNTKESPPR